MASLERIKIEIPRNMNRKKIETLSIFWCEMLETWDKCEILPEDDLCTVVFKKYFRIHNVRKIFDELRADGITIFKNPTDISNLLREGSIQDKQIEKYVKILQQDNYELSWKING